MISKMNRNVKSFKKKKMGHGPKSGQFERKQSKKLPFKRGKNYYKPKASKSPKVACQDNLEVGGRPPIEIQFAQKLAANEPTIRDRAVKKLRKWLVSRYVCASNLLG